MCGRCSFRCTGVCDADPAHAFRAAAAAVGAPARSATCVLERHHRFLVAAICRITGRFDIAHDLAQDVFVKALAGLQTFRGDAEMTTWLYAIARNCCYDYLRTHASRREVSEGEADAHVPLVENEGLRRLEAAEARRIVVRLMRDAALDRRERFAFMLHYGADQPLDTVTQGMGIRSRSGAKGKIVSARRKLDKAVRRWRSRMGRYASITPCRTA